ncbi:NADH-quinone oxidoreductase subunit NuoG [Rickettsiales bacterium]|nr:NADH-quinone oxidoreductase subunit NuoG [Rickettsiales bacterium]
MAEITINNKKYNVDDNLTIIQACEVANIEIPRFCYHEKLAIAGNCRMCLVEVVGGPPKPVASCAMSVANGMEIKTDSKMVKDAREGVMEFLLANHPLDCPICDQGGECDLQDQAYQYGKGFSEYLENKRSVKPKNMGPLIKTYMTRCIHCTRCVRFMEDIAGTNEIGAINRGEEMEIATYLEKSISSELSGNIIDLCPVGALTSKPYAFKARSWELTSTDSIDIMDAMGSNISIDSKGLEVLRILPRVNEEINEEWISDKARFCYDGLKYQRLDKSYIKKQDKLQPASYNEAINEIAQKFISLNKDEIALFSGQFTSLEEIFILNHLCQKSEIKYKECRLANQNLDPLDSSYLFNTKIENIDKADFCLLIGTNPRIEAPLLNSKIRQNYITGKLKIAAIGCGDADLTYKYNNLGNDLAILNEILSNKSQICKDIKNAKNPIMIIGQDAISISEGSNVIETCKKIAQKYNFITPSSNNLNYLSRSSGLINGLALNFTYSNNCNDILDKCQNNEIKMVILHNVDDDIDFEKLKNCFVIYIGSHGDKGAHNADIIIAANAFSEKTCHYLNLEGRIQKANRAIFSPTGSNEDFNIILDIAKSCNIELDFNNIEDARAEILKILAPSNNFIKTNFVEPIKESIKLTQSINYHKFNYYLTNPIARSSPTLTICSKELANDN